MANSKTGKVLATRCLQSECKLYIDLVLGTTEKVYQNALDEAKKLEPQHPEHLASLESSGDITSSQSSEDFITSSQPSDDLKSLNGLMASHSLGDNEDEDDQEEVQEEEEEQEQQEENNIKVVNVKEAGPVQFIPLDVEQRQATCELVNLKNRKPGQELKYVNVGRVWDNIHPNPPSTHRGYRGMVTAYLGPCAVQ